RKRHQLGDPGQTEALRELVETHCSGIRSGSLDLRDKGPTDPGAARDLSLREAVALADHGRDGGEPDEELFSALGSCVGLSHCWPSVLVARSGSSAGGAPAPSWARPATTCAVR